MVAIAISIVLNTIINAGTTVSLTSVGVVPLYGPVAVVGFVLAVVWGLTILPSNPAGQRFDETAAR